VWDEASTRVAVCSRSGGYCELGCGARASNMHHRRNRSQGGGWSPTNVAHLCGSGTTGCHGWVTHNPVEAHDLGLTLWTGEEPADVPILTALGPVWLTDDICPPRPGWL
jgi:5-methylcytosine-specific restriction protein A